VGSRARGAARSTLRAMTRLILAALVAAAALVAGAAPASAVTISCEPGDYPLINPRGEPKLTNVKAHNLPRRTDGYAPRCLVAEAVGAEIQLGVRADGKLPEHLRVYGARWSAGKWRCVYPEGKARCHRKGRPRQRVTMDRS
jgi:hypothetical protein